MGLLSLSHINQEYKESLIQANVHKQKKIEQRAWILVNIYFTEVCEEGLIQKQKVDIHGENDVQISIVAKNIVTQGWSQIMVMESKQAMLYSFFIFPLLSWVSWDLGYIHTTKNSYRDTLPWAPWNKSYPNNFTCW